MAHYDDLNTKRIFAIGAISVLVTVMTALAVQVLYFAMAKWQIESMSDNQYRRQNQFNAEQEAQITAYGVDEMNGNITIPIDKAIELVVQNSTSDDKAEDNAANKNAVEENTNDKSEDEA
ncbi:hypothetical protein Q31b_24870 [Novipirellula aureliae]|uniref:Uncharacterized protein n=1 Tax=Novipirellula aureliae TaxID=2527966 RepID=A0A5C6E7J5_9BACT|nr:hypothetical protein [Novipirellula aureliae]TWU43446.1 hypothetical protein Q31b_24870 [Novipirellula aureliae]